MDECTDKELVAKRAALDLRLLAAYLDDHDAGRLRASAENYKFASQRVKALLVPHMTNPRIHWLCRESQALHEILGNLLIEREPGMAFDLRCALDEAKVTACLRQ